MNPFLDYNRNWVCKHSRCFLTIWDTSNATINGKLHLPSCILNTIDKTHKIFGWKGIPSSYPYRNLSLIRDNSVCGFRSTTVKTASIDWVSTTKPPNTLTNLQAPLVGGLYKWWLLSGASDCTLTFPHTRYFRKLRIILSCYYILVTVPDPKPTPAWITFTTVHYTWSDIYILYDMRL